MQTIFVERVLGAGPRLACRTPLMSRIRAAVVGVKARIHVAEFWEV